MTNSLQEISKLTKEFKKELIKGDLKFERYRNQNWILKKFIQKILPIVKLNSFIVMV